MENVSATYDTRKRLLITVVKAMNRKESDINAQFACIRHDAQLLYYGLPGWKNLRKATTVTDATDIFMKEVEGCNDDTLGIRTNYANMIYNSLA